jgi:hypothetical protein
MTTRFEDLAAVVARHQVLAAENYDRVRAIAEHVRGGFCEYLAASDGECVYLCPPYGSFEPKAYGDEAFSMPPSGFRPIQGIAFGLAVRVTKTNDWMRVVLQCVKEGEQFTVYLAEGKSHEFQMPLPVDAMVNQVFFDMLHEHLVEEFNEQIEAYEEGEYGGNEIGFHMNVADKGGASPAGAARPVDAIADAAKAGRQGGKSG